MKNKKRYYRRDWEEWYNDAIKYKKEFGDLLIPEKYINPEGFRLGRWNERMRAIYNGVIKGDLNETQIKLLEKIGMVWKLEKRSKWNEWIERVNEYYKEYHNLLVPKEYNPDGYHLGYWIAEQRKQYDLGNLSKQQIAALDQYEMVWSIYECRTFDDWFIDAKNYYEENNDLRVPIYYVTKEGYKLGQWIFIQRDSYFGLNNRPELTQEQIDKLNSINMIWSLSLVRKDEWDIMFNFVREYKESYGKLPLWPKRLLSPDGRNVPSWISSQRRALQKGKTTDEQESKLNKIGIFAWKTKKENDDWDEVYTYIKKYYLENSKLPLYPRDLVAPNGRKLYSWILCQKNALKKGILSPERERLLLEIGITVQNEFSIMEIITDNFTGINTRIADKNG